MSTVDLRIGGMTCATCATRVERKLNRLDGVTASVNYATGTAWVRYADPVTVRDLVRTVEATGYTADPPPDPVSPPRLRAVVAAALTAPLLLLAMVPAVQFPHWQWLALLLATPVV